MGARARRPIKGLIWIRLPQRGREAETHAGSGYCGVSTCPVDMVLSPYTGVKTPGEADRHMGGARGQTRNVSIEVHRRAVSGGNGATTALEVILLNKGTTGGTGLDGLLSSDIRLNRDQLASVRTIGTENHGSADKLPQEGEA